MLDWVFGSYDVPKAVAEMDSRNGASVALAESLGFRFQETVAAADEYKGAVVDEHVYVMTREEWLASATKQSMAPGGLQSVPYPAR
jgi:RimJ/RimL family protein N-acetyltransferase